MKALVSILSLVALCVTLWLTTRSEERYSVIVAGGPVGSGAFAPRPVMCPPRSLPDDGVCIPVPRPASRADEFVPRLPERAEAFSAYQLPVSGEARLGTWDEFSLPEVLPRVGPALVMAPPESEDVRAVPILNGDGTLLAKGDDWVLLGYASGDGVDAVRIVALYAPLTSVTQLNAGNPVPLGAVIGKTVAGGFGLSLSRLRPGKLLQDGTKTLDSAFSIPTDPRNHLATKDPAATPE